MAPLPRRVLACLKPEPRHDVQVRVTRGPAQIFQLVADRLRGRRRAGGRTAFHGGHLGILHEPPGGRHRGRCGPRDRRWRPVDTGGRLEYLRDQPGQAVSDHAMTAKAAAGVDGVLAVDDFGRFATIVDGGRGHLLRAPLDAVPSATGCCSTCRSDPEPGRRTSAIDDERRRLHRRPPGRPPSSPNISPNAVTQDLDMFTLATV
jgi:hypothetical protein